MTGETRRCSELLCFSLAGEHGDAQWYICEATHGTEHDHSIATDAPPPDYMWRIPERTVVKVRFENGCMYATNAPTYTHLDVTSWEATR